MHRRIRWTPNSVTKIYNLFTNSVTLGEFGVLRWKLFLPQKVAEVIGRSYFYLKEE